MSEKDNGKKKYADNVVQFQLKKMKRNADHPNRNAMTSKFKLILILAFVAFLIYVLTLSKPVGNLSPIQISKHSFTKTTDGYLEIRIEPNISKLYVVPGLINGVKANFIIDTGASALSVPDPIAISANLRRGAAGKAGTAGGATTVYSTVIKNITINQLQVKKVFGHISPSMKLNGILLGPSVLPKAEFSIKNKIMTIRSKIGG